MPDTIEVTCTGADELLDGSPGFLDVNGISRTGEPIVVPGRPTGCGRKFNVDPEGPWDVKTDTKGNVVSRHRHAYCPDCGSATFIVEETL